MCIRDRYNIAGLISEDSEEVANQMTKNCRRRTPHSHFMPPPRGTPANIPINLYFQKLGSLGYIFVAGCMGLSSFKFMQWAPKDASLLQQSACRKRIFTANSHSKSFKVIHFAVPLPAYQGLHIVIWHCSPCLWRFRRSSHSKGQKLPSSTTPLSFYAPAKRNPREYPHKP